ncbi:putative bifunctional diguanylate cyclase/phosphodiesterase [Glaciecola sp. SC05]|uniref:putative bifunctional diguanylate cyclase/phosphodiesterase n=1 Tax=Glaciecola sp. SC05 TaxID=1987355 RepID=UPI003526FD70
MKEKEIDEAARHALQEPNELNNRRKDVGTRDAIDAIQELLFDPDASTRIFHLVLKYLADITDSDFAVCFVSGKDAEFPIYANTKLTPLYYGNNKPFVNDSVLSAWVSQKNLLTTSIYYNNPIPTGTRALLCKDIEFSSVMILPIVLHSELRAICVLANKNGDYTAALMHKLKPIIGAVMCTLQSAETVRGNFLGLDKKIANNRYLSSLISSSPVGVVVVNSDFTILLSNPVAQDMLIRSEFEIEHTGSPSLAGMDIRDFIPTYDSLFQWSNQQAKFGVSEQAMGPRIWLEREARRDDGSVCIVNLTIFRYMHGAQRFTTLQIQDTTDMRQSAEEYKRTSQQLNALTQLAPVAIIRVDKDWNCVFANDKWFEFSGLASDEGLGQNWINTIHSAEVTDFLEALYDSLQKAEDYSQEVRLVTPLGTTKWVDFSMRILFSADGEVEGFLGTCADVTERYITQEKLRHIAEYDGLTGLANRVLFNDRLQQAFLASQRDEALVSVFFLDLDGFKDVNDTLGHNIGDILLQKVAERLINTLRKNDTVARFGGDEFVVLLGKDDHVTDEVVVAEKVIQCVAEPYMIDNNEIFITTSLGVARGSFASSDPNTLLKNADFALYSAKREGKNKYQIFNEVLEIGAKRRINLLNELRTGLKRNSFCLYYQAICNSQTSAIVGFEALLRFTNKKGTIVAPDRFIHMLEETGMIVKVGRWVIEEACRQLGRWQKDKKFATNTYLTFNVSAKQLLEDSFVSHIETCCVKYGVDPSKLVMEMTESVIINKPEKVKAILKEIKSTGIRLALDDFGTGYSSLSYLQNYPFDIIKIDKSFLDDLSEHNNNTKIVKAIIALARSLELQVVAEGVESTAILDIIAKLGVNSFQGFCISKPVPLKSVSALLLEYP